MTITQPITLELLEHELKCAYEVSGMLEQFLADRELYTPENFPRLLSVREQLKALNRLIPQVDLLRERFENVVSSLEKAKRI